MQALQCTATSGCYFIAQIKEIHPIRYLIFLFQVPYSGNFLRTINFAVFMDFTATLKINPQKSYYSIQMQ